MRPARPLMILAVLLAVFPLAACFTPSSPEPSPSVVRYPAPCAVEDRPQAGLLGPGGPAGPLGLNDPQVVHGLEDRPGRSSAALHPESPSSGRGIVFDFDLLTENMQIEANVSDPTAVSASIVVVVRNNATLPLSVHLTATINLGGTVKLDPAQTPLLPYQATANIVVSMTLPEKTTSDSMGYLKIDGVCDQNPTVTNSLQVRVTIKQWHRVVIERFSLSSNTPLERDMVQLGARVTNAGNGPSNFAASAMVDGKPLKLRIDGYTARANDTVSLASGRFFMLAANWQASYGHHNFVLEVTDTGRDGETNASGVMSKDTKVASVFVGFNYRDLIPYMYLTIIVLAAAALVGYKFRKKLVPRLRRLKRFLKRGEPGSEGDEGYGDDEYGDDDEEYDDDDYEDDDEEYDDDGATEDEAPPARRPAAGKGAASLPKSPQAAPVKRPGAAAPKRPAAPAKGIAQPRMSPEFRKGMASVKPASSTGVIVVGDPDEGRPKAQERRRPKRPDEEG